MKTQPSLKAIALLFVLAFAAILVHGYHPFVEDGEIYVPGIKKALSPALYPYNAAFFASHARMTLFPNLVALSVRVTHLPLEWALFLWQWLAVFLLLLACWHFGRLCFRDPQARWGGVALVASLLTIPVAGTALYIMDQYLNTRSLSTPAVLFIILNTIERRFVRAGIWLAICAAIHPLMVVFGLCFAALAVWMERGQTEVRAQAAACLFLPFGLFPPVTEAYREVLQTRSYFFLLRWEWYEWLGIFAPLLVLWWFQRIARKHDLRMLSRLCGALIWFALLFFVVALVITIPPRFANLAELQPMRSLHLVYILLFMVAGGLLAQFWMKDRAWRWLLVFVPLCLGMFFSQRQIFPDTAHLEWPDAKSSNPWVETFVWVRHHTPVDAYFALDPNHMELPGEDQHGFRAIAERSMLADQIKDSGAVTMFPALAETWRQQVKAEHGWKNFQLADFQRLHQEFGVNWVILQQPGVAGLDCPYENQTLRVCQVP